MAEGDPWDYDVLLEHLYDLDQMELRRLAYEALLISDGPAAIGETTKEGQAAIMMLWPLFKDVPAPMLNWKGV